MMKLSQVLTAICLFVFSFISLKVIINITKHSAEVENTGLLFIFLILLIPPSPPPFPLELFLKYKWKLTIFKRFSEKLSNVSFFQFFPLYWRNFWATYLGTSLEDLGAATIKSEVLWKSFGSPLEVLLKSFWSPIEVLQKSFRSP